MAAWDFGYEVGPDGGPFTSLSDFGTVRIITEQAAGRRGSNPTIPYHDGEFSEPFKFLSANVLLLDVNIHYHDGTGAVTDPNGEAGHAYENRAGLISTLLGSREQLLLRRNDPHAGLVQAKIDTVTPISNAEARYKFLAIIRLLDGSWQSQTADTDTELAVSTFPHAFTINTGGNYEIGDAKFTLTCKAAGSNPSILNDTYTENIFVPGAFILNDVIVVDLARPRTLTLNGSRYAPINADRGWWIRLPAATTNLPLTLDADSGTWDLEIVRRNRWL